MKKIISSILILVVLTTVCMSLASCGETVQYSAAAEFYYSDDRGHTYGNMTKEYEVGSSVYMRVIVKVMNSNPDSTLREDVNVRITIPNATGYDGTYLDGQIVTPQNDTVQNITYYDFTVEASSAAAEHTFVFCFMPNAVSEATITLVFDDKVEAKYDRQNTIKFVAPSAE